MEKKKVIMKIESYSNKEGMLLLSVEDWSVRTAIKSLVELCEKKTRKLYQAGNVSAISRKKHGEIVTE